MKSQLFHTDGRSNVTEGMPGDYVGSRYILPDDTTPQWGDSSAETRPGENRHPTSYLGSSSQEKQPLARHPTMFPTPNILIVDCEGFHVDEEFYVKELAFFHPFTMEYWSGIFKAPFILTNCKKKLRNNIERNTEQHGLNWEHGDHPYYMVDQMLHFFGYYHILHAADEVTCRILQQHTSYTIKKIGKYEHS